MEPSLDWYEENSKKLAELNYFLQKRSIGKAGDHVIDVAIESIKELEDRNRELNREIGSYASEFAALAQSIGVKVADINILATRMCNPEEVRHERD